MSKPQINTTVFVGLVDTYESELVESAFTRADEALRIAKKRDPNNVVSYRFRNSLFENPPDDQKVLPRSKLKVSG